MKVVRRLGWKLNPWVLRRFMACPVRVTQSVLTCVPGRREISQWVACY